jgi:hypothetical protein
MIVLPFYNNYLLKYRKIPIITPNYHRSIISFSARQINAKFHKIRDTRCRKGFGPQDGGTGPENAAHACVSGESVLN